MSCHTPGPSCDHPAEETTTVDLPTVVLVGNPNTGKSTLFNRLTGARQTTMNAPGTTVQLERGRWRADGHLISLVDLPGTYSLLARSPDEVVSAEALLGLDTGVVDDHPDVAIVVVDACAVSRSLYLFAQVAESAVPVVVALTLADVARGRGVGVDAADLERVLGVPVVELDPRVGHGVHDLAVAVRRVLDDPDIGRTDATGFEAAHLEQTAPAQSESGCGRALSRVASLAEAEAYLQAVAEQHFDWVADVERRVGVPTEAKRTFSDRVDAVLLNPWAGILVFLAVMWTTFQLTTAVAAPMQNWIDQLFGTTIAGAVTAGLGHVGLADSWLSSLINDGLLAGLSTVATFIPPMAIMFAALALLEDSGYLSRAAFVADRLMRALGLDGRAFLPLLIGFGCNLPALAATRTLPNSRQRLLTGLLIPFTTCTARLTVFILLATVFFPGYAGTAIFLMYVASIVAIVLGGLALRSTVFRGLKPEPFIVSLPSYQRPRIRPLLTSIWLRTQGFVIRAGRVIVATLLIVWVLMAIPVNGSSSFGKVDIEDSVYGTVADSIAPVFTPAGFGDWHASSALAAGFVAKEVVVGSFAQSYSVSEPEDPAAPGDLGSQLRATFERTSGGHAGAAAAAFMVFTLLYTPCAATIAEQRRLFGWRPTLLAVGGSLVAAWCLAVVVFQVGALL